MPAHVHEDRSIIIYKSIYKKQVLPSDCAMTLPQACWTLLRCSLPSAGQAALQDMCSDMAAAGDGAGLQVACSVLSTVAPTMSQSLFQGQGPS